jgi:hypothetical protein
MLEHDCLFISIYITHVNKNPHHQQLPLRNQEPLSSSKLEHHTGTASNPLVVLRKRPEVQSA